jgi:hypothetical protein
MALIEDGANKILAYGADVRNEVIIESQKSQKFIREKARVNKSVSLVDEMKRKKEDLIPDKDPLLCFSMCEVTTLRPTGKIGGGKKWKWDISTKPRIMIKFGKVYTNHEVAETCEYLERAYGECKQIYRQSPNQYAAEVEDYKGSLEVDGKREATLYIGRTDDSFIQYSCNLSEESDEEQEKTNGGDKTPPLSNEEVTNVQGTGDTRNKIHDTLQPDSSTGSKNKKNIESFVDQKAVNVVDQRDTLVGNTGSEPFQVEKRTESKNDGNTERAIEIETRKTTTKQDTMPSIDTAPDSFRSEEIPGARRSTRKRCASEKFSECHIHNPTSKMVLPTRSNKNITLGSQQRINTETDVLTESTEPNTAAELLNKPIDHTKIMKCSAKLCPGYFAENVITCCCKCYRMVHKKEECSILCRQGENNGEDKEERVCIDCYSCPLLRKT